MENSVLKKVFTLLAFSVVLSTVLAQAPESFSYQAIVRDNSGQPLSNTSVTFQFNIHQGSASGTLVYSENHSVTTNDFGLVNLQIGQGTVNSGDFATIDWGNDAYFLNVRIDQGSGFVDMGTQQFISVPYAMYAKNAGSSGVAGNSGDIQLNKNGKISADPDLHWDFTKNKFTVGQSTADGRMIIQQDDNASDSIPILEVKNKSGQTVFVVYPDSVHFFINDDDSKGVLKGGFAVSGRSGTSVSKNDYLVVRPDSTRIYFKESGNKGVLKGGFAVSGRSGTKSGAGQEYFNISPNTTANIINPSEARILWYPKKDAFMAGQVLVESADSVGQNSWATGFESKSIGDYSQALGYKARALGDNSTAIGNNAKATGESSFAFGTGSKATGNYSFALGGHGNFYNSNTSSWDIANGPQATADYTYAFGMGCVSNSKGAVSIGALDTASGHNSLAIGYKTIASESYSTSMGYGTTASGDVSTAIGLYTTASGDMATAMGWGSIASGVASTAIGDYTTASGYNSTAMGRETKASGTYSTAMGYRTTASGTYSTAMGYFSEAHSYLSTIIGRFNEYNTNYSDTSWIDTDPLFVIGNGSNSNRHNAVTVLKNGKVGIGTNTPSNKLDVNGLIRAQGNDWPSQGAGLELAYSNDKGLIQSYDRDNSSWQDLILGGADVYPHADNVSNLGTSSRRWIAVYAKNGTIQTSDRRMKKNIKDINYGLNTVMKLHPVSFDWKNSQMPGRNLGLIAQEVKKVVPEVVTVGNDKNKTLGMKYTALIPVLIKAMQEQETKIKQLENENTALRNDKKEFEKSLNSLKAEVETLKSTLGVTKK